MKIANQGLEQGLETRAHKIATQFFGANNGAGNNAPEGEERKVKAQGLPSLPEVSIFARQRRGLIVSGETR